jgi:anti-sigma B factor antagonist
MYRLDTKRDVRGAVVCADGELDAFAAPELADALVRLFDDENVVFDLTAVTFMDSTALGLVARAVRELRELGTRVRVVLPESTARRIFEITTLDRVLPVSESVSEALSSEGRAEGSR